MKKIFGVFLVLCLVAAVIGCKSNPGVSDPSLPPWINEKPPEDMLWGVGVSDNAQVNMRMTMSDSRARQDLARQLSVLAQGMIVDYAREAGGVNNTAALQFSDTITRQVTDGKISGAVRDVVWTPSDNKTIWTRLKISKADAAKSIADEISKAIDSEAARYAEFKAMDALKMMDAQLEKNRPSSIPVYQ